MIYLRGRIWWCAFGGNKNRKRFSLGTSNKSEATARAQAMKEMRDARKMVAKAQSLMASSGVAPADRDYSWAAERWRKMNPRERIAVVFTRFGGRCVYCSREVTIPLARTKRIPGDRAVLDHKVPVSGGGSDSLDNIVLACNRCNTAKLDENAPEVLYG